MKKLLSIVICVSMVLAGCTAGGSTAGTGSTGDRTAAGGTEEVSAETASETEEVSAAEEGNASGSAGKPVLEVIGEEEEDFDRAVQNRSSKKAADPNAYMLRNYSAKAEETTATDKNGEDQNNPQKAYTVMVYIVGSNLESRMGAATSDIDEMRDAGLDYENTNLLLYTGGSRRWVSSIPNDVNSVLDMSKEEDLRIAAQTDVSANMGSPETLAEFINYCTRNYPAEHYALILWDHGGGPLWGYGSDELFGNDSLLLDELRTAMDSTEFGRGKKLDWVGFDACLMGSLENAALWKDYAQYLIGSEELEAGRGWDYHFLSTLNETQDAEEIVRAVVDTFGSYYEENKSEFFNPDVTLSAMDLSKTEEVVGAVDTLFASMEQGIGEGSYASLNQARSRTKSFGLGAAGSVEEAYDLLDLQDFALQLEEMYPEESAAVASAVDDMVIHSTSNVEGTGGMSIYVPGNNKALFNVSGDLRADEKELSPQYQSFVESYTNEWFGESEIDWHLEELQEGDGELTLQLTGEQAENVSQAYYTVLRRDGAYMACAMHKVPLEADENGVLHIPADPMLVTVMSDTYASGLPWTCLQTGSKDGVNTYMTANTFVTAAGAFYDISSQLDERVDLTFRNREGENTTEVVDVLSVSGSVAGNGKGSVDMSNYTSVIDMGGFEYTTKRKENGEILPFRDWDSADGGLRIESVPVPVDSSFRFIMKPASEFDEDFACQVVIKDVHDGVHATECLDFPAISSREIVEESTPNGMLRYELFEDHAEVCGYQGSDVSLEIPSAVAGKPVTVIADSSLASENVITHVTLPETIQEIGSWSMPHGLLSVDMPEGLKTIGNYAFSGYSSREIHIPDSVEFIGHCAFSGSELESVTLPVSLQRICAMPFRDCQNLKEILISEDNTNYKTADGVLYTEDGKTLVQYPQAKGDSYVIEEGTETIAYGAFAVMLSDSSLSKVEFPQSLKIIENAAFYRCPLQEAPVLPDSVEKIGVLAFGDDLSGGHAENPIGTLHLGPNVKYIGGEAFSYLGIDGFEVDPGNEAYGSCGGFLTNKAKDTILEAPRGIGHIIIVPEGITTLPDQVFMIYDQEGDFYLPDSVFRFGKDTFGYVDSSFRDFSNMMIHCSEGSAAEAYAEEYVLPYDTNTNPEEKEEPYAGEFTEETSVSGVSTLSWRVYPDHAELVGIENEYEEREENGDSYIWIEDCEIPAEYKGLPVTVLGLSEEEEEVEYPDAYVDKLTIPETVSIIHLSLLEDLRVLAQVEVADGNTSFKSNEGVLFTGDGKELLLYPGYREGEEYEIPNGTERIAEKAFYLNMRLKKITFPDTVTVIEENAFYSCFELSEVKLNEGLTTIGDYAFDDTYLQNLKIPSTVETIGDTAFELHADFGTIQLPENLKEMGYEAFAAATFMGEFFLQDTLRIPPALNFESNMMEGVLVKQYEADENNPYHTVIDGLLMSKDGKTLIAVPGQREGVLYVPDGVTVISYSGAFKDSRNLTDVYLPESVQDIGDLGSDIDYEPCPYKIHCYEGSDAQRELDKEGIPWVKIEADGK